jgi:hypothetical protein
MICGSLVNGVFENGGLSMTDAFKCLCLLMDMDNPRISAYEASMWPDDGFEKILAQGFLQQVENTEYVTCQECFDHEEEVLCRDYPGGIVRWFIPCPEHGRTEIEPDDLKQWAINFDAVARSLASQLNLTGNAVEIAPGHVWRLGRWNVSGRVRDILFVVGLNTANAEACRRAITSAHGPVVLIPHQIPAESYWNGKTPPVISLYAAAEFRKDQIAFDAEYILDVIRQTEVAPSSVESLTLDQIKLIIRKEMRTQGKVQITDDLLIAAYLRCGSYRLAEEFLSKETKQEVKKDRIRRAVIKAGGAKAIVSDRVSDSVVRSTGKGSRDTSPDHTR